MTLQRGLIIATVAGLLSVLSIPDATSFPRGGGQTVLPAGTELNEDAPNIPLELFHSEATGGVRSHLINLGDMAFNSPAILGSVAQSAGMSCGTCHVQGASNPKLYVPGMSTRPGNFDTTGPLFNPKADNGVLDPVTIPSLRGARYLAPYGHDGRTGSLRDFIRTVIVGEFAGAEPSPIILDALVAYIQDIDFLPNPRIDRAGKLTTQASEAERRGAALFAKPFPHDPDLSCAGCHVPSGAFVDHRQHDIGSGGLFKTKTLLNANFNAPYFHDGRYGSYDEVVAHFDRTFDLGLSDQDRQDLLAYLVAVGDAERPYERDGVATRLYEIHAFATVLDKALPAHELDIIELTVDTVGRELRDLAEAFPDRRDAAITGGEGARRLARAVLKEMVLKLRRIDLAATAGRFEEAATIYSDYQGLANSALPALTAVEGWSLFNPKIHDAHYAALRQMSETAGQPAPQ